MRTAHRLLAEDMLVPFADGVSGSVTGAPDIIGDPVVEDHPAPSASGVLLRGGWEPETREPIQWYWRAAPAGLMALGGFFPVEVDKPDLVERATTSSWESGAHNTTEFTLAQASAAAIQVFEQAEREIQTEREAEARFLASLWEDENL